MTVAQPSTAHPKSTQSSRSALCPEARSAFSDTACARRELRRPAVHFGDIDGSVVISSDEFHGRPRSRRSRVREASSSLPTAIAATLREVHVAAPIADSLHPVANPAVDDDGNIYVTFSGSRGQQVPVAIFRIDETDVATPFVTEMMNPTGMAFGHDGSLYVSSRYDGTVYRVSRSGAMTSYAEGMGVATGIAFDRDGNLYVGDRSGTIFKIGRDRQIFVFATIEPSVAAYHLAFDDAGNLYVADPRPPASTPFTRSILTDTSRSSIADSAVPRDSPSMSRAISTSLLPSMAAAAS